MTYTYKTIEKDGEKLVEKGGITAEFTIQEVYDHIKSYEPTLKEIEGKFMIEKAKQENIMRNHPVFETLTDEQKFAVFMYVQSQRDLEPYSQKKTEIENQIQEYNEELAAMREQVPEAFEGIDPVESPMQPPFEKDEQAG